MERYFAYGSNMNPERVRERGLRVARAEGATLEGYRLQFDKHTATPAGAGHANVVYAPGSTVEGVLYWLDGPEEIAKMDHFEATPVHYSREVVEVVTATGRIATWTYFANAALCRPGLVPPRSYLAHLLAGEPYLSAGYLRALQACRCLDDH